MVEKPKLQAFVQLSYGFGAEIWNEYFINGKLIGVNEPFAYGYHRAESYGYEVSYSIDHAENFLTKLIRFLVRYCFGFDFVHAWRNRHQIRSADVVWTHTESQSLAVCLLLASRKSVGSPKTIMQSVWLIDNWRKISPLRRAMYRKLLSYSDILTFHSTKNAGQAKSIFSKTRVEIVQFGINVDGAVSRLQRGSLHPVRVLAVGNDVHRDWATLRSAVQGIDGIECRVVTRRLGLSFLTGNARVVHVNSNEELHDNYEWADIVIVPLTSNLHASGITAVQEAIVKGLPVICTDVGGLRDYFPEGEVRYVPAQDPYELRSAINELAGDMEMRTRMVSASQARMKGGLNSEGFARRHVELSDEILGRLQRCNGGMARLAG